MTAAFLVQKQSEATIRRMLHIFLERNPKSEQTLVVITDKDMTKRNAITSEMSHIYIYKSASSRF